MCMCRAISTTMFEAAFINDMTFPISATATGSTSSILQKTI